MLLRLDDAVVVTRPLAQAVPDEALSASERGLCDAAMSEKRRHELRSGRAAAREAFREAGRNPAPSVLAESDGRPRLEPPDDWHVSLAHDGTLAAAAVSMLPVGVDLLDLQRIAQVERVVASRIDHHDAKPLADGSLTPHPAAALLWTAWEALGKRAGVGIFSPAMQLSLRPAMRDGVLTVLTDDARVRWFEVDGHLLCLAGARPT